MANSILVLISLVICNGMAAGEAPAGASALAGQDLHVTAPVMTVCQQPQADWSHMMLLTDGVTVQIGDNLISSQNAVISLKPQQSDDPTTRLTYWAKVYLQGDIFIQQGRKAKTTSVEHFIVEGADVLVTQFLVTGEVFAVADSQRKIPCDQLFANDLYIAAAAAMSKMPSGPVIPQTAMVPEPNRQVSGRAAALAQIPSPQTDASGQPIPSEGQDGVLSTQSKYPVHVSAVWEKVPEVTKRPTADGREVIMASGRFYVWQRRSEDMLVEFQADNLVMFTDKEAFEIDQSQETGSQIGSGPAQSVYLSGNIVMTEGERTIRADEIYYDFVNQRALVVNASMRVFDEKRNLPIYLRAERLGKVSEHIYEAQNVQLTTSEFYLPQTSLNASRMVLLKDEAVSGYAKTVGESQEVGERYEGRLHDVTAKFGEFSFFHSEKMTTNFKRPDIPLSKIRIGNDSEFGTSVETRWHLARLLGMKDPPWAETRLAADYFSKRGYGAGIESEYETDEAFGSLIGYVMDHRGEDDLGRISSRRNLDPEEDIRGRFSWRHRQMLDNDWQLTAEVGYLTDENFLEWMYRDEFYTDKEQETLLHLKKQRDNWAFSILGKVRINDFETVTEELPSIEYHRTGQSFWNHSLTWYSDTQVARFRERTGDGVGETGFYTFAFTRNEVDMPLTLGTLKIVPFVAGSFGYDDGFGYSVDIDGNPTSSEQDVFLGEVGLRASTMFWKEDPYVQSKLWDLNGLRHIVTPYVEAVLYEGSDDAVDMRDTVHVGVSQRWQTHRGSEANLRTLDWIRWDVEGTWVSDDASDSIGMPSTYGPAAFIYNDPSIPLLMRRMDSYYGIVRDTITSEFAWRVTDATSFLGNVNYDIDAGHIQQLDVGVSRYVYPDISYYLGSRYLRPVIIADATDGVYEEGSHSVVAAITYRLTPRYTATFSQEYNFDFGESVRSDLTIIRQYHRMFYAVSISTDESLRRNSILFSIWPQGVKELAVGSRKYSGLTGARTED